MHDIIARQIKDQAIRLGVKEITTPGEVDDLLTKQKGSVLIFMNSVCGCAGGIARPALEMAMNHPAKPDVIATVFASEDREAALRARSYFTDMPPSSPSFAILRDGRLVQMIHRSDIEIREPREVAALLTGAFDAHCQREKNN